MLFINKKKFQKLWKNFPKKEFREIGFTFTNFFLPEYFFRNFLA